MSEFKGTKGEWKNINVQISDWSTCCVGIDKGAVICNMYYEGIEIPEETKYNAQLIAHAPQMLEMLKELMEDLEGEAITSGVNDTIRRAKQLIKQATTIK